MTAGVAHDLGNPLEGIANYLDLLARPGTTEEARTRYVERVKEGFERIRALARELLAFAEPGTRKGPVDLAKVLRRAEKMASFAPDVQRVEIVTESLDEPLEVLGDASRLEQVFFNLLTNAATAMRGREGGRILVSAGIRRESREPEQVEIRVADEGPGIDPQDLDRIFDPFFSRSGGLGLGLSVCYATAVSHGGSLTARNRAEGGAEFLFRLPASAATRTVQPPAGASGPGVESADVSTKARPSAPARRQQP
jgi:signal transduction histidine kinase